MKIVVLVKQTFDTEARIKLTAAGEIDSQGIKRVINPYCEFAIEKALQMIEQAGEGEVIVLAVGGKSTDATLRSALAMGAHQAIWVDDPALAEVDESATARVLAAALETIDYDLVLAGFQSVDDTTAQVPSRVAEILDIPLVTVALAAELHDGIVTVTREIDDGVEIIDLSLPAMATAQQGLAEPRYPSMRGIMQAKKKPLQTWSLADLNLDGPELAKSIRVRCCGLSLPQPRQAGKRLEGEPRSVALELLHLLQEEAKVI